jgi:hypothetical protein
VVARCNGWADGRIEAHGGRVPTATPNPHQVETQEITFESL